jgi:ribosomal-protein-alanine N-acetyltransferase
MTLVLDEGYISNVAVAPMYRGQGIGSGLIRELIERARKRGASFLTLEVRQSNIPARRLYEKFGFCDVGCRRNYYDKPIEDAINMTLFLK